MMIATGKPELVEHAAVFGANSYAGANHIDVARSGEGPAAEVERAGGQAGRQAGRRAESGRNKGRGGIGENSTARQLVRQPETQADNVETE